MADTFHFFPKLPPELQLMVWQHYRQDRGSVRHYLRLMLNRRYHTAYNTKTGYYERATAQAGAVTQWDPVDPDMTKIQFIGHVRSVPDYRHHDPEVESQRRDLAVGMALFGNKGGPGPRLRSVTTTHAWVHFADDIFVFDSSCFESYCFDVPGMRRLLASGFLRRVPRPPAAGSWPAHIRTLAFYPWYIPTQLDHAIFRMMDGLRTVLLVSDLHDVCTLPRDLESLQVAGYVDVEHIIECHKKNIKGPPDPDRRWPCPLCERTWRSRVPIMDEVMQSLGKRGVKVKDVYDYRWT